MLAQGSDRGHHVERRVPLAEACRLGRHDRLGALGLAAATGEALGDDGFEVVDVVEEAPLELGDRRLDVARDGQVDQEERRSPAPAEPLLDIRPLEHEARRARRGDDDVRARELLGDPLERERLAAQTAGQLGRAIGRAVGDEGDLGAAGEQVPSRELSDLAGARRSGPACPRARRTPAERGRQPQPRHDAGLSPIAVSTRAFRPACSAPRNSRSSTGPQAPASYAARTCPRISPSPGTIESSPAATRKRCSAAASSVRRYRYGPSGPPARRSSSTITPASSSATT